MPSPPENPNDSVYIPITIVALRILKVIPKCVDLQGCVESDEERAVNAS